MASVTRNPRPLFVTALPAGYDGQEVFFQSTIAGTGGGGATDTMATTGAVWHLRYRSASASAYKWEFVGGSKLDVTSTTSPTTITATSPTSLSTNPNLTLPVAGTYRLEVFANGAAIQVVGGNKAAFLSVGLTGGMTETAVTTGGAVLYVTATTLVATMFASYTRTITGASTVLTMKAWVDSGQSFFPSNGDSYPYGIRATPIRVG